MTIINTPTVIGVGASAGGLEALEQFFSHVSTPCYAAFVVIQHLDPNHRTHLQELLQRITPMKVTQAGDGMNIKPNWIYVIPPNKDLSILHGKLHLLEPVTARGVRLPIDFFFKALAADQHERAVGVILSGMGSDGSLGLRAIKKNAGLACAQTPESAKFETMPRTVISVGLADIVAEPEALWGQIDANLHRIPSDSTPLKDALAKHKLQSNLEQIVCLLRERTGNDFSLYKKNTLYRRIERRMDVHQIDAIANYVLYLRENPQEQDFLFKELLIGVTHFFRDIAVWEALKSTVIPNLLAHYPAGKELRAWVQGCSTGEEAYSIAIAFKEVLERSQLQHRFKLQIFATDIDQDAIAKARRGFYPATIKANVSPERLDRFFILEDKGYRIKKQIRDMVVFATQNVIMDPPFTKLDLISCRNLLIYFSADLQKKLIPLFHFALAEKGVLLLGNAETINNMNSLFATIDSRHRLFERIEQAPSSQPNIDFPIKYFPVVSMNQQDISAVKPSNSLQSLIDQLLLQRFAPAAVVVNAEGDILHISGRTGKYLEPTAGKANWNIHTMARDGLRHELAIALRKAQLQTEAVFLPGLTIGTNGGTQTFSLTVQAISQPEALRGKVIVVFNDLPTAVKHRRSLKTVNADHETLLAAFNQAREELQTLREERQTSQEELNSSNEELQSTNEELQSINEELTTSKEELQSLNEELQTVNAELQAKVTNQSWVNNDLNNLLDSMDIATVFLDNSLNIRRFTSHATQLFKFMNCDVGRPLSDIVTVLDYPELHHDAQEVMRTMVLVEKQVQTHGGKYFKARIMPYRTHDNVIDGAVITFIDITETKILELQLRENNP